MTPKTIIYSILTLIGGRSERAGRLLVGFHRSGGDVHVLKSIRQLVCDTFSPTRMNIDITIRIGEYVDRVVISICTKYHVGN